MEAIQQGRQKQHWENARAFGQAFLAGEWVTHSFSWFYMMVSRFAGPLMTIAVGYLIVYAIESHHGLASMPKNPSVWDGTANFASGLINVMPELVFPGTVVLSIQAIARRNWLHCVLNAIASLAFVILTLTLLNAFMTNSINDQFLAVMLLWRAVSSLFYTVVAEICSHRSDSHQASVPVQNRLAVLIEEVQNTLKSEVQVVRSALSTELQQVVRYHSQAVLSEVQTVLSEHHQAVLSEVQSVPVLPQTEVFEAVQQVVQQEVSKAMRTASVQLVEHIKEVRREVSTTYTEQESTTHSSGTQTKAKRRSVPPTVPVLSTTIIEESSGTPSDDDTGTDVSRVPVQQYILDQVAVGRVPSLNEIVRTCKCSKSTAIDARKNLIPAFSE